MIRSLSLAAFALACMAPPAMAQATRTRPAGVPANGAQATGTPRLGAPSNGIQPAGIQPGTSANAANAAAVNDALFANAAASGGMAEVALAELGVQKATNADLKKFSQRMIDEHSRMNTELMTLAAQKRVALPRTPDARAQFCAQSLAGLSGEKFDECYARAQLLVHEDAVATFTAESERGQDPEMKALAAKALPHIKEHLKTIKPIAMKYHEKEEQAEKSSNR